MAIARRLLIVPLLLLMVAALVPPPPLMAQTVTKPNLANVALMRYWARTDLPVAVGAAQRSYYFGDDVIVACRENYQNAPKGERYTLYFDKARLEQHMAGDNPDPNAPISAGLLTKQLITGLRQVGDGSFISYRPAAVPVAGDPDSSAPTYASFQRVTSIDPGSNRAAERRGQVVTQTLNRSGDVGDDQGLGRYGAVIGEYSPELGHNIPQVFLDFFSRTGVIGEVDDNRVGRLAGVERLIEWVQVMGLPIAEPYWAVVPVGGVQRWVLIQPFERRVVTYTPDNQPEFQVEMGNVGLHFQRWIFPDARTGNAEGCIARQPDGTVNDPGGQVVFGPIDGELPHVDGKIGGRGARVNLRNFTAEARFFNPYPTSEGKWSYGFGFRDTGVDRQYRLVIDSDGDWALSLVDVVDGKPQFNRVANGRVPNLNRDANGANVIQIAAVDRGGTLVVNSAKIADLPLDAKIIPGDVFVGTGFYAGYKIDGRTTRFDGFVVRALPEAGSVPGGPVVRVEPGRGNPATRFTFRGAGFKPNEAIGIWFTDPAEAVWYPRDRTIPANGNGAFEFSLTPNAAFSEIARGRWAITARGVDTNAEAVAFFEIQ